MNYARRFVVEPGAKIRLDKVDPGFKAKHDQAHKHATVEIQKHVARLAKAQSLLYADGSRSLLVLLQHSMPAARTASCATFLPP